jgi:hypothetical protein
MNHITVKGGRPRQRELIESIVNYVIKKLMPRTTTLDIDITIKTLHNAEGYCLSIDKKVHEIEVSHTLPLAQMLKTVAHEMVHVKQVNKGELGMASRVPTWRGKKVSTDKTDYWDLPWEIEAYGREVGLFHRWAVENDLLKERWITI